MHGSDYEPPVTPLPFQVKDSGVTAEYADGMRRDTTEGKPRFDLLIPTGMPYEETLLYRAAMHYMLGGKKYGDRNWEKSRTAESLGHHTEALWRHFMKFVSRVEDGEDHAAAIFWNLNAVLYTQWRLEQELAKADASAVQDDDADFDLQKWHRESGTSEAENFDDSLLFQPPGHCFSSEGQKWVTDPTGRYWIEENGCWHRLAQGFGPRTVNFSPAEVSEGAWGAPDSEFQEQLTDNSLTAFPTAPFKGYMNYVFPIADPDLGSGSEKVVWAQSEDQARQMFEEWAAETRAQAKAKSSVPKFGTPEFDAKFAEVAAEQAESWPTVPEDAANPSDDDVAIAEDVLRRRQFFYDREASELWKGPQ